MEISVVIPVFNEAGNVRPLMAELAGVLERISSLALQASQSEDPHPGPLPGGKADGWEVIWVDDGSADSTLAELSALLSEFPGTRVLSLAQRSGQSAALWAGLQATRGNAIVTLDGDGQNDPADIPRLLDALNEADLVVGCRRRRQDSLARRLFSRLANAARNALTGSRIPDSGCGLRAFWREVLDCLIAFDGLHRFLPTLAEIGGKRVRSLDVGHRPRRRGRSKYGIAGRIIGPLLDCLMLRRLSRRRLTAIASRELRTVREPRLSGSLALPSSRAAPPTTRLQA